eukprot:462384-Amphidinium_carterae.1
MASKQKKKSVAVKMTQYEAQLHRLMDGLFHPMPTLLQDYSGFATFHACALWDLPRTKTTLHDPKK